MRPPRSVRRARPAPQRLPGSRPSRCTAHSWWRSPTGPAPAPSYAVALADGDLVPVRGPLAGARPFSQVTGRLALPTALLSDLAARGTSVPAGATLDATSTTGREALRLVDRRSLTLRLVGTPLLTDPEPAISPTAHQQYVAAIDNKGNLNQNDSQLLGHVTTVGSYWQGEANGAITGIGVPASVTHYDTTVAAADCGLGNDFWNVVQEAAAKFSGIHWSSGSDQLVLFVPDACSSGGVVGEGSVGSSFASGGALIVKAGSAIEGTYAHETGHNYGFAHANARYSGSSMEYYGVYDVMGFAIGGFNQLTALSTPFRVFQGVTDAGEIQDVDLGTKTAPVHAAVTIKPRSDDVGLRSVRVVDPDTGESLYLDYRSGGGQDVGAFYADTTHGYYLNSGNGPLHYAPGVTISAARGGSGVDTLVVDGSGDTSLGNGATWTNASGTLTVHVSALAGSGADVSVDFTPPQAFTTVGTPALSGSATVGGTVSLDVGTWNPVPTTVQVRWFAGGQPWAATTTRPRSCRARPRSDSRSSPGSRPRERATSRRPSTRRRSRSSPGTIPVTADPTVTGTVQVGSTLQGHAGTWGSLLSTVSSTWQWRADGTDIPGATSLTYSVQPGDVGKTLSLAEHLTATGYQATTIVSDETGAVPAPVITPAPTPTVSGTPSVGAPLHVTTGTWMSGVTLSYQWSVDGSPVSGAIGTTYTPAPADLGKPVHVAVTGTARLPGRDHDVRRHGRGRARHPEHVDADDHRPHHGRQEADGRGGSLDQRDHVHLRLVRQRQGDQARHRQEARPDQGPARQADHREGHRQPHRLPDQDGGLGPHRARHLTASAAPSGVGPGP